MYQVVFSNDKTVLQPLYDELLDKKAVGGTNFVLMDDDTPIGVCRLNITDGNSVEIADFATKKTQDGVLTEDFFWRTVLFKLSFNPYLLRVNAVDERLKKFGFLEDGNGGMEMLSCNAQFPSSCHNS